MVKVRPGANSKLGMNVFISLNRQLAVAGMLFALLFQPAMAEPFSVEPYTHSRLVSSDSVDDKDYLVLVSAPKRINNQLRIEKELRVDVKGQKETYRVNDGHTTEQAFNHYFSELKQLGGSVIYQCASRDCGRSTSWAQDVFGNAKLYGEDASQFYLAAAVQRGDEQWLVSVYAVERGNRRVYTHVETLRLRSPASSDIVQGVFGKKNAIFVFSYELSGVVTITPDMADINKVIELSEATPSSMIYIVGHLMDGYSSSADAIARSQEAAEIMAALLRKRGVDSNKLSVVGVGPLVPVNQGERSGNRIEVIVLDK
ncbi:DUF4892 domain-containing protein [Alkalimarinus coralli]|uniref:DUF4892 domain-containing protein n=1 Tax=Alkalimarinus coralli TaxID=2935863 RepID=UPI00202B2F40|nr:DUF4892 domain-containing protein [Alkalimarinus coralli]